MSSVSVKLSVTLAAAAPVLIDVGVMLKLVMLGGALAVVALNEPVHPERDDIRGCHHVYLKAPGSTAEHSRHAMAIHPGWFDRSPCGTGTCARMATLHARGQLGLEEDFGHESIVSSLFVGRLVWTTRVGPHDAVIPTLSGCGSITGLSQFVLDPGDPFPRGFLLG